MPKFSTRIALLALVGTLSVVPSAFAAPTGTMNNNNGTTAGQNDANSSTNPLDCALPANRHNPLCYTKNGSKGPGGNSSTSVTTNNGSTTTNSNTTTNTNNGNKSSPGGNSMFGKGYNGPKPGSFNFNQQDRSFFHRHFNGFNFGNFGFFGAPTFSITIGTGIPFTYQRHLQRVPASVYRFYPWFRGYFFFIDRRGDFVIVSPRTFRIVAVL